MTSFKHLFGELFKIKSKKLLHFSISQLVMAVILAGLITFKAVTVATVANPLFNIFRSFLANLARTITWTGLFIVLISLVLIAYDTEKINRSQTWRLIPIDNNTIYLSNLVSSLIAIVILVLLEFFGAIAPMLLHEALTGQGVLVSEFFSDMGKIGFLKWLQIIVALFLLLLAIFLIISFLNFSSYTIVDFLPHFSGKLTLMVVRLVIILLICWLGVTGANTFWPVLKLPAELITVGAVNLNLLSSIGILAILDLFTGMLDIFLMNNTFETEPNK
ncbi:hypothetical protein OZY43_04345 [Lactobacillus sp. ESL0785]|uniref:hypothetical protein n=1 Tax=Lactobacillus sp. ESL0785 TaxID=2983232 RepID=UPI0023F6D862|nr:hypothetical protein [Lactobacillus sp. ESL0785]WEV70192.1 hypothetical protein OZY43_04345 [Lactobacillus sp. ESL0785]